MTIAKLLVTGLAAASLAVPAAAAVRPSVKPIEVSVQQSVAPAIHNASRAGAKLEETNGFLPVFAGLGVLVSAVVSSVAVVATLAVVNQVVELPLINDVLEEVGAGNDDEPESPGN